MRKSSKAGLALVVGLLWGCGGTKMVLRRDDFNRIKTVAVIEYTVSDDIEYRENPREVPKESLTKALVKMIAKADSAQAATTAHASFCEAMNRQGLSFRVLTPEEMKAKSGFAALAQPMAAPAPKEEPKKGMAGRLGSMMSKMIKPQEPAGVAPDGLNAYGLAKGWPKGSALTGKPEEKKYIADAAKVLGVDAVLVVNDPGFSFSCTACAGALGNMNGAASTGSAFMAALVGRDGEPVMEASEWFATSGSSAVMAMSSVDPLEHNKLFKAHGQKMAAVLANIIKKNLAEKK